MLLLHQYGFTEFYGLSAKYIKNLTEGKSELFRQIIENEDYRKRVLQLKHAEPEPKGEPHNQNDLGFGSRPSEAAHGGKEFKTMIPKIYGPGGVQYDPPKPDKPMEKANVDLRPKSDSVGASAKPKSQPPASKSRP